MNMYIIEYIYIPVKYAYGNRSHLFIYNLPSLKMKYPQISRRQQLCAAV